MHRQRLSTGLTAAFGGMGAVLLFVGLVSSPIALPVAAVFGFVAGITWLHASGRLVRRVYRRVEQQAAVDGGRQAAGAGPKAAWSGPHDRRREQRRAHRRRVRPEPDRETLTPREAATVLDVDPDADAETIRAAYRDRIKDVHPDAPDGTVAAFRRVRSAYERLSD